MGHTGIYAWGVHVRPAFKPATDVEPRIPQIYLWGVSKDEKISLYDVDKIMIATSELFQHLNKRYEVNEKLNTEVDTMVRTCIDETKGATNSRFFRKFLLFLKNDAYHRYTDELKKHTKLQTYKILFVVI